MTTSLTRTIVNKCLIGIKNHNASQKRLESFKAALLKESNTPLVIDDSRQVKKLESNQVRVEVNYCSLNSYDVAQFNSSKVKDFVPGYELSGEVLEIGSDVKPAVVTVGEKVAVLSRNRGGFAEQCVVEAGDVWRLSSNVKRKDAAVLIFGHSNAILAFSHLCNVNEKTKIVISTGSGGLGLAAIDVAATVFKTKPVGICQSEELSSLVRETGAFKTATFKSKNLTKQFEGADIVYDAVGGEVHDLVKGCVKPGGQILYAGPYNSISTPPLNSWLAVLNVEGLRTNNFDLYRQVVSETLELADQSIISAHISAEFKLAEIDKAIKFIEEKKCTGKILIKISD